MTNALRTNGINVLLDDRDISAGNKFNDAELIGINKRIVISKKAIENKKYEILNQKNFSIELITESDLLKYK